MAENLNERIQRGVLLLDGGLGSLFIADGLAAGEPPERWVLEHPDRVERAHRAYAEAGSDVVHTTTFGGNRAKLATMGLGDRVADVNRRAVELARRAADGRSLVAGDIGPTGELFSPMGTATAESLAEVFSEQANLLAEAGADLLSVETMYDLREAAAAVSAAVATGLPVLASMTFDERKRGFFTMVGDQPAPALTRLAELGAAAVGFNCSLESDRMLELVRRTVGQVDAPLCAQPNAGQPRPTDHGVVYDADPDAFADDLLAMVDAGAKVVGGCCGTDPSFVARARRLLDSRA